MPSPDPSLLGSLVRPHPDGSGPGPFGLLRREQRLPFGFSQMSRGHGDCFLLAMPRDGGGNPVYVTKFCNSSTERK